MKKDKNNNQDGFGVRSGNLKKQAYKTKGRGPYRGTAPFLLFMITESSRSVLSIISPADTSDIHRHARSAASSCRRSLQRSLG